MMLSKKCFTGTLGMALVAATIAAMWSTEVIKEYYSTDLSEESLLRLKINFVEDSNNKSHSTRYQLPLMESMNARTSNSSSTNVLSFTEEYLKEIAPDLFERVPTQFLENYRNPCWFESGNIFCLPYFYLVGFHKCGTTDLFTKLLSHPSLITTKKEPHWWAIGRVRLQKTSVKKGTNLSDTNEKSSLDYYFSTLTNKTFAEVKQSTYKIIDSKGTSTTFHPKVFGDGSVSTITRGVYSLWKFKENPDALPYLMHALQPHAKIIVSVRDPVSRFRSMYYRKFRGATPEGLHEHAQGAVKCATECLDRNDVRQCAYYSSCVKNPQIYIGIYKAFIEHWGNVYGMEHILVSMLEDRMRNPVEEFKKVIQYLELENLSDDEYRDILNTKIYNRNGGAKQMLNETKTLLRKFYKPFNKQLAAFMDDEKYLFGY